MPRRRLGAVLLIEPPHSIEIDGLRRAVGDPSLGRIAPHLTLVPPVNVPEAHLGDALNLLRSAAAHSEPFTLALGPVSSFLPANPVLRLEVSGSAAALGSLSSLRDRVFTGPFDRGLTWPWVPHVTLAADLDPVRIAESVHCLDGYGCSIEVDRLVVLEEVRRPQHGGHRRWAPLADANLGGRRVVGRGGLEIELTAGRLVDPEAAAVVAAAGMAIPAAWASGGRPAGVAGGSLVTGGSPVTGGSGAVGGSVVVTARRLGAVVGVAGAWVDGAGGHAGIVVPPDDRHQGIGTHLLAALELEVDRAGWGSAAIEAIGSPGFFSARSGRYGG